MDIYGNSDCITPNQIERIRIQMIKTMNERDEWKSKAEALEEMVLISGRKIQSLYKTVKEQNQMLQRREVT